MSLGASVILLLWCLLVFCLSYQAANSSLNTVSAGKKFMTNPCISFESVIPLKFKILFFQSSKDFLLFVLTFAPSLWTFSQSLVR